MDAAVIRQIAHLKIRMRQLSGLSLNTQRFFAEPQYARQILDLAEESESLELVTTALELRDRLGWLQAPAASATPAHSVPVQRAEPAESARYRFGPRS